MKKALIVIAVLMMATTGLVGQQRLPGFLQDQSIHIVGESVSQFVTRDNLEAFTAKTCTHPHRKSTKETCAIWADAAAGQPRTFSSDEYSKIGFVGGKLTTLEGREGKKFYLMNPELDDMTKICILIASDPTTCAHADTQMSAYQYAKSIARVKRLSGAVDGYSPAEVKAAVMVADAEKMESTPVHASGHSSSHSSQSEGLAKVRAESEAADAADAAGDNAGMMRHLYNMQQAVYDQESSDQQTIQDVLDSMPNP